MSEFREVFAERVRAARKARGFTQHDLADRLSAPQMLISKYERELVTPRLDSAWRMACELGVSVDWLCGAGSIEEGLHEQ